MILHNTFTALADQNRQKILDILKKGELSVTEILEKMDITMATLSHHLDILKRCNLVSGRRQGRQIFYSLNLSVMEEVEKEIIKFFKIKK
jgi:DNA-binding transcriptional ArsR family regulator